MGKTDEVGKLAIKGGLITFAAQGLRAVVQIIANVVLSRLISPDDYGVVAIATTITGFVNVLKDGGLSTVTVQRASMSQKELSNLFWVNSLIGLVAAMALVIAAPVVALWYTDSRLSLVVSVLSISLIIGGIGVQFNAIMRRNMQFAQIARIELISLICSTLFAIVLAAMGAAYWALVG